MDNIPEIDESTEVTRSSLIDYGPFPGCLKNYKYKKCWVGIRAYEGSNYYRMHFKCSKCGLEGNFGWLKSDDSNQ